MQITLEELRRVTDRLYDHLASRAHQTIDVPDVYYWSIPRDQRVDRYDEPKEFTIGQTSDDWEELRKISAGESDPLGYGLVWLSSILREIGEQHAA